MLGLAPLLISSGSGWAANRLGCVLSNDPRTPCLVLGLDISGMLTTGFGAAWLTLYTLWLVPVAVVVAVVAFIQWWRARGTA
jgi:hypothetical protein